MNPFSEVPAWVGILCSGGGAVAMGLDAQWWAMVWAGLSMCACILWLEWLRAAREWREMYEARS